MKTKLILFFALLSCAAFAQGPGGGGNQPGGGSSGSFTFDTFVTDPVTSGNAISYDDVWSGYVAGCTAVTLSSSITGGVECVMSGCTTLETADLSAATGLTKIPSHAFAGCSGLTTVKLPSSVTEIGDGAFEGCAALSSLTATGVTTVGADAFRGCAALTAQPAGSALGDYAFAQTGLTSVDLSSATLGKGVCYGCESLASATFPAALPAATFGGCTTLTLDPSGLTSIGAAALAGLPIDDFTLSSSVTLGSYALAANAATLDTTLVYDGASVPATDDTTFLGRGLVASYTSSEGVLTRVEALALVTWLTAQAEAGNTAVTQPSSYATADLETWLATASNADAILSFCYEDSYAADASYHPLDIAGTTFLWGAPDEDTTDSVALTLTGATALDGTWLESTLSYVAVTNGTSYYVSADGEDTCFARIEIDKGW